ncbi:dUTP diphosphatase [bacterium]|nr:dUTP diphosphatase [bacterium]
MTTPEKILLKRVRTCSHEVVPQTSSTGAAGLDLVAALSDDQVLQPGERAIIPTGIAVALPSGCEGQVRPRSGLALKHGVTVLNSPGTIDSDYRGEIQVILINHGQMPFTIRPGDRIAQLIICRYQPVEWAITMDLDQTERNTGGFGHTGR